VAGDGPPVAAPLRGSDRADPAGPRVAPGVSPARRRTATWRGGEEESGGRLRCVV
jgi:hypothetical protein